MIPDVLLFKLLEYIRDNNTCINLLLTCKYFKKIFYEYGYLKIVKVSIMRNNPYNFMLQTDKHRRTLNMIEMLYLHEVQHWIAYWPNTVFFNHCTTGKINPTKKVNTEFLYILNDRSKKLWINWEKFPKLKIFYTTSWNFNHEDVNENMGLTIEIKK